MWSQLRRGDSVALCQARGAGAGHGSQGVPFLSALGLERGFLLCFSFKLETMPLILWDGGSDWHCLSLLNRILQS